LERRQQLECNPWASRVQVQSRSLQLVEGGVGRRGFAREETVGLGEATELGQQSDREARADVGLRGSLRAQRIPRESMLPVTRQQRRGSLGFVVRGVRLRRARVARPRDHRRDE
jgi:hypothetical protein